MTRKTNNDTWYNANKDPEGEKYADELVQAMIENLKRNIEEEESLVEDDDDDGNTWVMHVGLGFWL